MRWINSQMQWSWLQENERKNEYWVENSRQQSHVTRVILLQISDTHSRLTWGRFYERDEGDTMKQSDEWTYQTKRQTSRRRGWSVQSQLSACYQRRFRGSTTVRVTQVKERRRRRRRAAVAGRDRPAWLARWGAAHECARCCAARCQVRGMNAAHPIRYGWTQ